MLNWFILIYVFVIGLILGSFYNVCIYRIPKGVSVAFPPSHCTNCSTRLKALDLIPVLSYIFLKGKCRYCKDKISPRYAVIELLTGILFAALYLVYDLSFLFLKYAVLTSFLMVIGMIDYDTTDVYFKTTISGIIAGIIFLVIGYFQGFGIMTFIYGALLGGLFITLIILLTKGMGWGDVEICLMCGLYLGLSKSILLLFLSFVVGGLMGGILILTKEKSRKDYIPFGPFIAIAAVLTMLFADKIIGWYVSGIMF
jgi:leader peptidase (prepilin peptidase) / N-methyltransferase